MNKLLSEKLGIPLTFVNGDTTGHMHIEVKEKIHHRY